MAYLELVDEEFVAKELEARTPEPVASEVHVAPEVPEELEEAPAEDEPVEEEPVEDDDEPAEGPSDESAG
jgi:hypothetical protein